MITILCIFFFFKDFIYLFFRQGKEGGKRERNISVWLLLMHSLLGTWPTTQACALDWELNWWPFGSQASTQPLSHTSQGCIFFSFLFLNLLILESKGEGVWEGGRKREREGHRFVVSLIYASLVASSMCPDLGWNPQTWCVEMTLTNWATWPRPYYIFVSCYTIQPELLCKFIIAVIL